MSVLIKNATVLTPRGAVHGDLFTEANTIAAIGRCRERAEHVIDGTGKIAMPGLVNAHTHVAMNIFRGYGEDLPLTRWLEEKIWPIEAKQKPSDIAASARLAFCEMLRSGTTAFAEMCLFDTKGIFTAAKQAGMRGIISRCFLDFEDPGRMKQQLREIPGSLEYGDGATLRPSVAAHAPYTCSEEILIRSKELARKRPYACSEEIILKSKELAQKKGLKYQIHVSETRQEVFDVMKKRGKYPYEYLDSIGVMDKDSLFAHGGWLTKREILLGGKRGVSMAHCPVSSMKLATGGIAQITELDAAGANVCLGTDGSASNNSLDMFQTMKVAALLQKHHYWQADILPCRKVLDFATVNGAKALGFDAGALEPGKLADVVLLERGPNMHPEHDLISNIVYAAGPQNVTDVIIDGRPVMLGREILTLDEKAVMEEADRSAADILRR
ncbi:MAG: amidohydrolase [Candidatus ainarchaeum sp.]|nr:amidohydrolase [Candidatus ainarchaeum sp.]